MPAPPKVIERLPHMEMREMIVVWGNAVRILTEKHPKKARAAAREVVGAIEGEWRRRGKEEPGTDAYFPWPSTNAPAGCRAIQTGDWEPCGVLSYMGYHVGGLNGRSARMRQAILARIFEGPLPPAFRAGYLAEWGNPETSQRLQKMAETLAALARNAKRRNDARMIGAVRDWERDLKFLYDAYYIGRFQFSWPTADILFE